MMSEEHSPRIQSNIDPMTVEASPRCIVILRRRLREKVDRGSYVHRGVAYLISLRLAALSAHLATFELHILTYFRAKVPVQV